MTAGRRVRESYDFAEAAQLQRDIVALVVHDLGSIVSALALRLLVSATRTSLVRSKGRRKADPEVNQNHLPLRQVVFLHVPLDPFYFGRGRDKLGCTA